jgi:hypothetical protein
MGGRSSFTNRSCPGTASVRAVVLTIGTIGTVPDPPRRQPLRSASLPMFPPRLAAMIGLKKIRMVLDRVEPPRSSAR